MSSLRKYLDTTALYTIYATLALLPIFVVPSAAITLGQAKFIFVAVGVCISLIAWFLARLLDASASIPKSSVLLMALLVPLAYLVSAVMSHDFMSAFSGGLGEQDTVAVAVLWTSVLLMIALSVRSRSQISSAIASVSIGLGAMVIVEIARILIPSISSLGGTLSSTTFTLVGSWHDLGILVGLVAAAGMSTLIVRASMTPVWRYILGAFSVLSFLFLFVISLSDVWYVTGAFFATMAVSLYVLSRKQHGASRSLVAAAILGLAIVSVASGWFNTSIHDMLPQRLSITSVEVRPSLQGTIEIGANSLSDPKSLIFGSGPNSFSKNWVLYKPAEVNQTVFWNFDFGAGFGSVPTSFVTTGALGAIAWTGLIVAFIFSLIYGLRHAAFGEEQSEMLMIASAILYIVVFQVIYVPGLVVSALLFMLLGIFVALITLRRGHLVLHFGLDHIRRFGSSLVVVIPVVLIVSTCVVSGRVLASDIYLNRSVITYNNTQNQALATSYVQKSLSLWPANDRAHRAAVELGILELARLAQSNPDQTTQAALQDTLARTIEHGLTAVKIDDSDYQNWLSLAQLYTELAGAGVEGAIDQAQKAFIEARADNPTNPLPLLRLAQLEMAKGNADAAIGFLDQAIALKQNYALAYHLKAQLLAQKGDLEKALQSEALVVQLAPEDPVAWYALGMILYAGNAINDAAAAFAQAAILRPDYSNAYFMYALAADKAGETEQAIQALLKVGELNPGVELIPAMIANLSQGKKALDGLEQSPSAQQAQTTPKTPTQ